MTYSEFLQQWRSDTPVIIANTSGSTGKPRSIELPKEVARQSAMRTIRFFGLDAESRLHSCISPDFIGGKMMAVRAELCGARLSWEEPSMTPHIGEPGEVIDLVAVVPAQMHSILDRLGSLPHVRNYLIGGSAIPGSLRRRIAQAGITAYESYGMTETSSHIALRRVETPQSPFRPLTGVELSTDTDNALIINLPGLAPLRTNDIVEMAADGSFSVIGRRDNIINTGGRKVSAETIEALISQHAPDVAFYVAGMPHPVWGQEIVVVTGASADTPAHTALQQAIQCITEHWQRPKRIITDTPLQYTPNGKIIRNREL